MAGKIRVIDPGAYVDVVAVGGDPLSDIKLVESVDFVMKGGEVFQRK